MAPDADEWETPETSRALAIASNEAQQTATLTAMASTPTPVTGSSVPALKTSSVIAVSEIGYNVSLGWSIQAEDGATNVGHTLDECEGYLEGRILKVHVRSKPQRRLCMQLDSAKVHVWESGKAMITAQSDDKARAATKEFSQLFMGVERIESSYRVMHVLTTVNVGFSIKLDTLCASPWAKSTRLWRKVTSYEPEMQNSAVFCPRSPTVSINVFSSGSVNVTGCKTDIGELQLQLKSFFAKLGEHKGAANDLRPVYFATDGQTTVHLKDAVRGKDCPLRLWLDYAVYCHSEGTYTLEPRFKSKVPSVLEKPWCAGDSDTCCGKGRGKKWRTYNEILTNVRSRLHSIEAEWAQALRERLPEPPKDVEQKGYWLTDEEEFRRVQLTPWHRPKPKQAAAGSKRTHEGDARKDGPLELLESLTELPQSVLEEAGKYLSDDSGLVDKLPFDLLLANELVAIALFVSQNGLDEHVKSVANKLKLPPDSQWRAKADMCLKTKDVSADTITKVSLMAM